jgi:diacylglycerol kinase family enzyme
MSKCLSLGVVINPMANAGRDQSARLSRLKERLVGDGHRLRVEQTAGPGGGIELGRELAAESDVLLAVGGDGTFCEVVGGFLTAGRGRVRGVAPVSFGTGNDVARHVGLRQEEELFRALDGLGRLERGEEAGLKRMDVLEVRCWKDGREVIRHGFLFAAVGFASDILRYTTPTVKRWFGPQLSYSVGFFRALASWQPVGLRVRTEKGLCAEPLVVALAANAPHAGGGGMRIAPDADLTDGLSEVSLIRALGKAAIARQFIRLTRGTHIRHPRVDYFRSAWMEVESDVPQPVALDGDIVGETPMRVRVLHRAVPVLAAK